MNESPSLNGSNGIERDAAGRFVPGNRGGPGNPMAQKVNALRAQLLESATPERMGMAVEKLWELVEAGDLAAIKELFDRLLGKPLQSVDLKTQAEVWRHVVRVMGKAPSDNGNQPA